MQPSEAHEQMALFQWAEWSVGKYPELALMFHIPNGGSRNVKEAANLKRQGVKAGVPDVFLPVARGNFHGLFIELKRANGGRVSVDQKKMLIALRDQGYEAVVCHGFEDAANVIQNYLEGGKQDA